MNIDTAIFCSQFSGWVYKDILQMTQQLDSSKVKYNKLKYFERDGAQAYGLQLESGKVVIGFRGTEPTVLSDIVADLKALPTSSDTIGMVHEGFREELDKIYYDIVNWIGSLRDKDMIVTGHSLGAAMATIFASRMHYLHSVNLSLYTFGSPRVGNREWAEQFKDINAYRFVNNNDIVCKVPPGIYYEHVGAICYIRYSGKITFNERYIDRLLDRIRSRFKCYLKFQLFNALFDHDITKYVYRIINRK